MALHNVNSSGNDDTTETLNAHFDSLHTEDGVKIGIGGTWEEFDLGAQPLVHRNGGDFYNRATPIKMRLVISLLITSSLNLRQKLDLAEAFLNHFSQRLEY